jgi:hypothetical protein
MHGFDFARSENVCPEKVTGELARDIFLPLLAKRGEGRGEETVIFKP